MALPRPLLALWVSQTLSLVGSDLTRFGVGLWAYEHAGGSVEDFAWVTVCAEAPALVLAPVTGLLVDRIASRRGLLATADWLSLAASLWLWRRHASGQLAVSDVHRASAVQSVASSIQWPAFMATVPALVPPDQLVRVGAVNEAIPALVMLLAPSIAGAILAAAAASETVNIDGLTALFALEAVTCVLGSAALLWVELPRTLVGPAAGTTPATRFGAQLVEPMRFVLGRPALAALLLFMAGCNVVNGLVRVLFTPLIMAFAGPSSVAMVLTLSGTGAIVGSLVLGRFAPDRPVAAMLGCSAVQGVLLAVVGARESTELILAVAFCYMALIPAVRVCRQSIFQRETPPALRGRVFALLRAVREGCVPVAGLVAGPAGDALERRMATTDASGLAAVIGPWIGVGKGRGVAALFVAVGGVYTAMALAGLASPRLSRLDAHLSATAETKRE